MKQFDHGLEFDEMIIKATNVERTTDTIKITFIGDIMCEPLLLNAAKRGDTYDFHCVFDHVKSLFSDSDYVIGNLETPLAGEAAGYVNGLFSFNAPDEFAIALKNAGVDFVSTANNHCMDRGIDGLKRTITVLNDIGLSCDGTHIDPEEEHHPFTTNIKGTKVAIIPFTYATNYADHHRKLPEEGYVNLLHNEASPIYVLKKRNWKNRVKRLLFKPFTQEQAITIKKKLGLTYNSPRQDDYLDESAIEPYFAKLKTCFDEAKANADIILFYPHVGGQFNTKPGRFTEYTVQKGIEYGADAIIASHPHIVQKTEFSSGIPIFYSVGNFSMSPNSAYLLHENLPDFGLAVHLYITGKDISKVTFSILKIIESKKHPLSVWPVDELINSMENDDEISKLEEDVASILRAVTNRSAVEIGIQAEYTLSY